MAIGLRYAGTSDQQAYTVLVRDDVVIMISSVSHVISVNYR